MQGPVLPRVPVRHLRTYPRVARGESGTKEVSAWSLELVWDTLVQEPPDVPTLGEHLEKEKKTNRIGGWTSSAATHGFIPVEWTPPRLKVS